MILLLPFLTLFSLSALGYDSYDANRRVPFSGNSNYTRDEYRWWISSTKPTSTLWLNGVVQSQESGTNDLRLNEAHIIQPHAAGVKVAVIDSGTHGGRIVELLTNTAPQCSVTTRVDQDVDGLSQAVVDCVNLGSRIVVLPWGSSRPFDSLSNACRYAESNGTILVCSVINSPVNTDTFADYPTSWSPSFSNLLPVAMTDRSGNLYSASAWGTNTVAAPGRNVVCGGTYSSGTSYAAPLVAGCLALLMVRFPKQNSTWYIDRIRTTSDPIPNSRRINPVAMLAGRRLNLFTSESLGGAATLIYSIPVSAPTAYYFLKLEP